MFSNRTVPLALVKIPVLAGCGGGGDSGESEAAPVEAAEAEDEMGAAAATGALVNPNLATDEELMAGAGIGGENAAAVTAGRPYLRAADLHAVLSEALGEEGALAAYDALWLPINLNDVTTEEILLIPGVGDRMAHEIGKYVDEDEVERLARYVYVPIDLNAATREEIMAVPGMSERMAHEFEEYRPYVDMDEFRREIGKYVDEDEVARFERYVTLN